jgi:flagellar basal body rod protein FlgG
MILSAIGASGLAAYGLQMQASANNIANVGSEGYDPLVSRLEASPVAGVAATAFRAEEFGRLMGTGPLMDAGLEGDMVGMARAARAYEANLAMFRVEDRTLGSLIDRLA